MNKTQSRQLAETKFIEDTLYQIMNSHRFPSNDPVFENIRTAYEMAISLRRAMERGA